MHLFFHTFFYTCTYFFTPFYTCTRKGTVYDYFYTFEDMKMASPGMSFQAYLRMLEKRTVRFGRVSISFFILQDYKYAGVLKWKGICLNISFVLFPFNIDW